MFVIISTIEWLTYAIVGNFNSGTERAFCFTNRTVLRSDLAFTNDDASLKEVEKNWLDDMVNSDSLDLILQNETEANSFVLTHETQPKEKKIKLTAENFIPFALKGALESQKVPNFLSIVDKHLVTGSREALTKEGPEFVIWCANTFLNKN